ncbi:MAG TPA: hypothetical protein VFK70_08410, partial [Vicinamibacteria bacterium]|nr:hypothetical protein [Vicinamibacteria bacterium]
MLQRKQDSAFRLDARAPITAPRAAEAFLARVGIALRYGPTKGLPLASLYQAFAGPDPDKAALARGIAQTNRLLGEGHGIEVHVIADRVTVVHRSLMPALYALVRRGRALDDLDGLSAHARTALTLLRERKEVTAGDVRQRLGLRADPRNDPAYAALGELTHVLLVDRGPFAVPKAGIPYLSTEGYPYHLIADVHPDIVRAGARLEVEAAADALLGGYVRGAVFVRVAKLATLFRFLSKGEIGAALGRLAARGTVALEGAFVKGTP